jgi:hypothetical protein
MQIKVKHLHQRKPWRQSRAWCWPQRVAPEPYPNPGPIARFSSSDPSSPLRPFTNRDIEWILIVINLLKNKTNELELLFQLLGLLLLLVSAIHGVLLLELHGLHLLFDRVHSRCGHFEFFLWGFTSIN